MNWFSPERTWTNKGSVCKYKKSPCTELGQFHVTNGTNTEDATCRCDYTKGYTFVVSPMHTCFCFPQKEDCSCYEQKCPDDQILSKGMYHLIFYIK